MPPVNYGAPLNHVSGQVQTAAALPTSGNSLPPASYGAPLNHVSSQVQPAAVLPAAGNSLPPVNYGAPLNYVSGPPPAYPPPGPPPSSINRTSLAPTTGHPNGQGAYAPSNTPGAPTSGNCMFCLKLGLPWNHGRKACPLRLLPGTCDKCGEKGHFGTECARPCLCCAKVTPLGIKTRHAAQCPRIPHKSRGPGQ